MKNEISQILKESFEVLDTLKERFHKISTDLAQIKNNAPKNANVEKVKNQISTDCKNQFFIKINQKKPLNSVKKITKDSQSEADRKNMNECPSPIGSKKSNIADPQKFVFLEIGSNNVQIEEKCNQKIMKKHPSKNAEKNAPIVSPKDIPILSSRKNIAKFEENSKKMVPPKNSKLQIPLISERQKDSKMKLKIELPTLSQFKSKSQLKKQINEPIQEKPTAEARLAKRMSKSQSQKLLTVVKEIADEQINQKLNNHLSKISETQEKINSENENSKADENDKNDKELFQIENGFLELDKFVLKSETQETELKPGDFFACEYEAIFSTFVSDFSAIEPVSNIENMEQLDVRDKMFMIEVLETSFDLSADCPILPDNMLSVHERLIVSSLSYLPKINTGFNSSRTMLKIQAVQKLEELNKKIIIIDDTKNLFVKVV